MNIKCSNILGTPKREMVFKIWICRIYFKPVSQANGMEVGSWEVSVFCMVAVCLERS